MHGSVLGKSAEPHQILQGVMNFGKQNKHIVKQRGTIMQVSQ